MNPSTMRPFPISVVAMGPGSQEDDAPEYLAMPQGMGTFSQPRLPENAAPDRVAHAANLLGDFLDAAKRAGFAGGVQFDLLSLELPLRDVINQSLGFGEVRAFTTAPEHWRVQETAFAGFGGCSSWPKMAACRLIAWKPGQFRVQKISHRHNF